MTASLSSATLFYNFQYMNTLKSIENRRSIRAFKPDPIPDGIVKNILKAASRSPSYTNTQPWEVAVVSGKIKDDLSQELFTAASSDIPISPDIQKPSSWPEELDKRAKEHSARRCEVLGIERSDKKKKKDLRLLNFKFYGAPVVLFIFIDTCLGEWSILDTGMFAQNIMISALEFGLGTCPQASLTDYPHIIKKHLNIPETKILVLGISIGFPDNEALINTYRSDRVEIDKFTRWY